MGVGHNLQVLCCCQACTWWIYGCWALRRSDRFAIKLWHWNVAACTHTHKCCQYIRRIVIGGFQRKQHICALLITSQRHVFKRIERTTCDGWTWSVDGWSLKNHHLLPQFLKNNLPRTWCTTKRSYHVCLTLEMLEMITHAKRSYHVCWTLEIWDIRHTCISLSEMSEICCSWKTKNTWMPVILSCACQVPNKKSYL